MHCTGQHAKFEHWIKQQCADYAAGSDAADTVAADDAILPSKLFRWVSLLQAFSTLIQLCSLGKGHQHNICTTASSSLERLFCFHEHIFHLIPIPLAPLYNCCCRWVQQSDVQTQLQPGIFSSSVRGLAACKDLNSGSTAIRVPETLLITEDTAKESDLV